MTLTIAGLQHHGVPGDVEANLALVADAARQASDRGADLLVTPEMFITGYNLGDRLAPLATPELVDRVAAIAAGTGIAILAGLPEPLPGGAVANAIVLIGPDGSELLRYRKTTCSASSTASCSWPVTPSRRPSTLAASASPSSSVTTSSSPRPSARRPSTAPTS